MSVTALHAMLYTTPPLPPSTFAFYADGFKQPLAFYAVEELNRITYDPFKSKESLANTVVFAAKHPLRLRTGNSG